MDHKELRQIITDFSIMIGDLQEKIKSLRTELDQDREEKIKKIVHRLFKDETVNLFTAREKDRNIKKKVIKRILKRVKTEVNKLDLDSMGQILKRIKEMSEYERLAVCEFIISEAQIKNLKKQNKSQIFTGTLD